MQSHPYATNQHIRKLAINFGLPEASVSLTSLNGHMGLELGILPNTLPLAVVRKEKE